jgi:hypothetical protein
MQIPFATYRELQKGQLEYFIVQKDYPHFLGRIVTFPVEQSLVNCPVAGYNLWVTFNGTLRGNFIPAQNNITDEIQLVFERMALWFASERIMGNGKRFDKFKIKK